MLCEDFNIFLKKYKFAYILNDILLYLYNINYKFC